MDESRLVPPEVAAQAVRSGMRVRFPTGHNPQRIGDALATRLGELRDVEMVHCASGKGSLWLGTGFETAFSVTHEHWAHRDSWSEMKERRHDYLPMPFSLRFKADHEERPAQERRKVDVVCVQVSPPDDAGRVNLGPFPWDAPEYMRQADVVLAEVVPNLVVMSGDGSVPAELVTHFVEGDPSPEVEVPAGIAGQEHLETLAAHVASLISDGDCLQIGFGTTTFGMAFPLAERLTDRNDLGWHSEATPPVIPSVINKGVINSKLIPSHPGVAVSAGWNVLEEDRAFVERNDRVQAREIWKVVDPRVVADIPNFKAINTAIMVDLTGQAAAESIGTAMRGGTGGLLELTIGALWSRGGRSILVLGATDATGERSRILPVFPEGTQGTVPRTLVDTVVTEYGVARLWGKTVRERADALTEIAAPQFRDELAWAARQLFHPSV